MSKAVIYARVSTREQEEEGYSIESQTKLLREYAANNGYEVVHEYVEAESAKEAGRKQFGNMVKFLCASKDVKTILVEKTDRLYRNFSDASRLDIEHTGITIVLVKEGRVLSKDSRSGDMLMHDVHLSIAKYYINNLKEETSKGLLAKAEAGEFPSKAPQGYMNDKETKRIEPNPKTARLVKRLFELYATGDYSLETVSQKIASEGLLAAGGRKISRSEISFILSNVIYYGKFRWKGRMFAGIHEPLVSRELFEAAQRALRRLNKPRKSKKNFAYRGLLTCGKCGCLFTAELTKGKYVYYHCSRSKGPCDSAYIREEQLDTMFADEIKKIQPDRQSLFYVTSRLLRRHNEDGAFRSDALARLRAEKTRLKVKMDKAYNDKLEGEITDAWWKERSSEWRKSQQDTDAAIERLEKGDAGEFNMGLDLLEMAGQASEMFKVRSLDERRQLLNIVASNFLVNGKSIVPTYKKPFDLLAKGLSCSKWLRD